MTQAMMWRTHLKLVAACLASLACLFAAGHAAAADSLAVQVTNTSEPVLCAEKDNVTINLQSPSVRRFSIEAAHPAYIGTLQRDSFEADWTACDMAADAARAAKTPPRRKTLYEDIEMWVVGLTFADFWRPATACGHWRLPAWPRQRSARRSSSARSRSKAARSCASRR
jgi:hypothetical protein